MKKVKMRFEENTINTSIFTSESLSTTNYSTISNNLQQLELYTNWHKLYDGNGIDLFPDFLLYEESFYGYNPSHSGILVPTPGKENTNHSFIHLSNLDTPSMFPELYYSEITNQTGNWKLEKERILVSGTSDSLNTEMFTVKHGNGRDWWVYAWQAGFLIDIIQPFGFHVYLPNLRKFLLAPEGLIDCGTVYLEKMQSPSHGDFVRISPDNTLITPRATHDTTYIRKIDRCTGEFRISIQDYGYNRLFDDYSFEFSPNSRYIYFAGVNTIDSSHVFRMDLEATSLFDSKEVIAATGADASHEYRLVNRTPNGKIIITSREKGSNDWNVQHIIHNPDAEQVADIDLELNAFEYDFSLKVSTSEPSPSTNPNYSLGPLIGSPCDTIDFSTNIEEIQVSDWKAFPNPTSGLLTLKHSIQEDGHQVILTDLLGRHLQEYEIDPFDQEVQLDFPNLTDGLYILSIRDTVGQTIWQERLVVHKE